MVIPMFNKDSNPVVFMALGDNNIEMSLTDARRLAMGIIEAAQRANTIDKIGDSLIAMVGKKEAEGMIRTLENVIGDEL